MVPARIYPARELMSWRWSPPTCVHLLAPERSDGEETADVYRRELRSDPVDAHAVAEQFRDC